MVSRSVGERERTYSRKRFHYPGLNRIFGQRRAIVEGLRESVDGFQRSIPGTSAQDVMNLILMT